MSETNNYPERQVDICDHEVFCVGGIRQFIYPASGYLGKTVLLQLAGLVLEI